MAGKLGMASHWAGKEMGKAAVIGYGLMPLVLGMESHPLGDVMGDGMGDGMGDRGPGRFRFSSERQAREMASTRPVQPRFYDEQAAAFALLLL